LEVVQDGVPVKLGGPRERAVLGALLLRANETVSVGQLVESVWETPPASPESNLRTYVASLRRRLGSPRLVTSTRGYLLNVHPGELDLAVFEELVATGESAIERGDPRHAVDCFERALHLWRGDPFEDQRPGPLLRAEATRVRDKWLRAVGRYSAAKIELGEHRNVVDLLRHLVSRYPLREELWVRLMVALHGSGRRAEALSAYAQVRELLADELGVEPGVELRRAHRDILCEREPDGPRRVPYQLPADVPALVGRDRSLATAGQWLASRSPWIAVTGPGGVGKTAFAVGVAQRSRHRFPDGILMASLDSSATDESVLTRFLRALGIPVDNDLPADPSERAATFWELLAGRRVLLVLDDVRDEAHVRPLLPPGPGCGLLVISRRRLAGLESLRALPLDVLPDDAGIRLLRARAGDRPIDEHAAAAVVRACDGLPLAINIAGARLTARPNWTVVDLSRRLADARSRLDWLQLGDLGVRATLSESMSGLAADHRRLLCRLGLLDTPQFAGWVAAALLDRDMAEAERALDDLVEAHLVEPVGHGLTGPRYQMHGLIRLVARELTQDGDDSAVGRVLHGWLALAAAADDRLAHWIGLDPGPPPMWWPAPDALAAASADPMRWFDEEHDALVHAVHLAADGEHAQVAWAIAQRLSTHLELRGRYREWRDVLDHGLRGADAIGDRQGQATMLGLLMQVEGIRDEHRNSLRYAALTVAAYRELTTPPAPRVAARAKPTAVLEAARRKGDALAVGFEASRLALALRLAGKPVDYLELFEEAREAFHAGGAPLLELWTLKNIGLLYLRQRRFTEAEHTMWRAQEIHRELGEQPIAGYAGGDLAGVAAAHGRADLAERLATEALDHARLVDDQWSAGRALITLAELHAERGEQSAAKDRYGQALAIWQDLRMTRRVTQIEAALEQLATK
jgi:DNA-binding SARP family transcriptional activator